MNEDDAIMVFTRVSADGFDAFMSDPELVLAVVEEMGFDHEDLIENADPMTLYQMMEGRWSGEERNFSFEKCWPTLRDKMEGNEALEVIGSGGRNSQIYNELGPIKVLSAEQVKRVASGVLEMEFEVHAGSEKNGASEEEFALSDLLPGLKRFFELASESGEFVLLSWV